ncbi:MAG: DMT family transporter, partial [Hyphomicrobiaceae bacterium]|nr:DMT family transporter [Hyphomicrobiaceae bacterium]
GVMALRLASGAVALYIVMRIYGPRLPTDKTALLWFSWLGTVGAIIPFFLISCGAQYLPSGLVGISMAVMPLVTIGLAHFILPDEPLTPRKLIGFLIGFAGLVLLVGPQFLGELKLTGNVPLAQLAVLVAAAAYSVQAVTARKLPPMNALQKSTGVMLASALIGVSLALVFDPTGLRLDNQLANLSTLVLGLFPTALAALLLFRLLDRTDASFVSIVNYLLPPFAYFLGILALDEPFESRALLGLAVIMAGIYLAERGKTKLS